MLKWGSFSSIFTGITTFAKARLFAVKTPNTLHDTQYITDLTWKIFEISNENVVNCSTAWKLRFVGTRSDGKQFNTTLTWNIYPRKDCEGLDELNRMRYQRERILKAWLPVIDRFLDSRCTCVGQDIARNGCPVHEYKGDLVRKYCREMFDREYFSREQQAS
jgi:hypothetical protein